MKAKSETEPLLHNFVILLKISLAEILKSSGLIMERRSTLAMFMTNLEFYIKGPMWKPLNKILLLRENINIYL